MAKKRSTPKAKDEPQAESQLDFESALSEVERIVSELESGDLNLTESLQQYEMGIRRLKRCHALLDTAEQRVSLLSGFDAAGNPVEHPIAPVEQPIGEDAGQPTSQVKRKRSRKTSSGNGKDALKGDDGGQDSPNGATGQEKEDSVDDSPGLF